MPRLSPLFLRSRNHSRRFLLGLASVMTIVCHPTLYAQLSREVPRNHSPDAEVPPATPIRHFFEAVPSRESRPAGAGQAAPRETIASAVLPIPAEPRGSGAQKLKLPRRARRSTTSTKRGGFGVPFGAGRMLGSLGVVLAVFASAAWALKAGSGKRGEEGAGVFEELGRFPLVGRHTAHIVRFGSKLLVLAPSQSGVEKLTELSTPEDVGRVLELCRSGADDQLARSVREFPQAYRR